MRVIFFARLRDALGAPGLEVPVDVQPATVADLRAWLASQPPQDFGAAMADPNMVCAVNQRVVDDDQTLADDDEIAFFPPVTGG